MAEPADRPATYADLEAVPPHLVAEIIDGVLRTHHHGAPRSAATRTALLHSLSCFQTRPRQQGGWHILHLPEMHLGGHVFVPDLCGWRAERLPILPVDHISIVPDWACEITTSETVRRDRCTKRTHYAALGVLHLWLVDPNAQTLESFALADGQWRLNGAWSSDDQVSALPFDAISLSLADLWPLDRPLGFDEDPQALYAGDR